MFLVGGLGIGVAAVSAFALRGRSRWPSAVFSLVLGLVVFLTVWRTNVAY